MPLDPQAQRVVDAIAALNLKPLESSTPAEAREAIRTRTAALGPFEEVAAVTDHRVPVAGAEVTVRTYSPGGPGPHPVLVYYHGGGWVIGDLYTHDGLCRSLTNAARCVVASVDYRLAPEWKYPVAADDAYAALRWVVANAARLGLDPRRVAIGGDSAGGNLATVAALMARERGGPALLHQVLIYPVTDNDLNTLSYIENSTGYILTREGMRWFWNHYLAHERQGLEPHASPLRAPSLAGLPPALVITAECDPLRDEGEAYAARLRDAGVPVTVTRYAGMFHGFVRMTRILDKARTALDEIAGSLQKAFAASS
ncbi:MAG TPA: alpha/beta hydrolase [Methylomirabilota bacterium]|jgi:acetyl esterase|nr:alpha/beta hydrolase [Methylomirabilota bacterium]